MAIKDGIKGTLRVFMDMTREEWHYTDRKVLKLVTTAVSFAIAATIWWFFFRTITPF